MAPREPCRTDRRRADQLNESETTRAAVESVAEHSLEDMVGHPSDDYRDFGSAPADHFTALGVNVERPAVLGGRRAVT